MRHAAFIAIYAILFHSPILKASEADGFTERYSSLSDASNMLNTYIQERIDLALTKANKKEGCHKKALYKGLSKTLVGNVIGGPLEIYINKGADKSKNITVRTPRKKSIYRDITFFQAPVLLITKTSMGGIVRVPVDGEDLIIGADKFGHFFTEGYHYFKKADLKKKGIEKSLKWGVRTEKGKFGKLTVAVFSYGDLIANYNGYLFWANVLGSDDRIQGPYFACKENQWQQVKKFVWADYIDSAWDEGINCNNYVSKKAEARVTKRLLELEEKTGKKMTCPVRTPPLEKLNQRYAPYAKYLLSKELRK